MSLSFDKEKLDQIIQEEMKEMNIPGLAIAIVSGTDTIYQKGFGRANESGKKITDKTAFFIGSSSKSFTAMAIMQLAEEGLLDINEPAVNYLPDFKCVKNAGEITILHLLNHTSGFSTYEGMKLFDWKAGGSLSRISENYKGIRLSRNPGASYEYSNLNYVILGAIIEVVSGMTYKEYVMKKILEPLDMNHTFADFGEAQQYGLEKGYQPVLGRIRQTAYEFHPEIIPAGYLVSNAEDMAHYLIANLNNGKYKNTRLLSEDGMSKLHTKSSDTSGHYGLGWFDYGELVHHGGSAENYHANMMLLPAKKLGIVILYNINDNISGAFIKGSFGSGETVLYDRIQSRIINALTKKDTVSPVISRGKGFHQKVTSILAGLFILFTLYGCALIRSASFPVLLVLIINLLLPVVLLLTLPKLFKAGWKAMLRFAAGLAHALYALQIYLIIIGALKTILVILL